jgi:hypothetical protein
VPGGSRDSGRRWRDGVEGYVVSAFRIAAGHVAARLADAADTSNEQDNAPDPTVMFNKIMTCRTLLAAAMIFVAADTASIGHAQDAGLIVGDEPITELEIEQRSKFTQSVKRKTPRARR